MHLRGIPLGLLDSYGTEWPLVCISNTPVQFLWCGDLSEAAVVQIINLDATTPFASKYVRLEFQALFRRISITDNVFWWKK